MDSASENERRAASTCLSVRREVLSLQRDELLVAVAGCGHCGANISHIHHPAVFVIVLHSALHVPHQIAQQHYTRNKVYNVEVVVNRYLYYIIPARSSSLEMGLQVLKSFCRSCMPPEPIPCSARLAIISAAS